MNGVAVNHAKEYISLVWDPLHLVFPGPNQSMDKMSFSFAAGFSLDDHRVYQAMLGLQSERNPLAG